MAKVLVLYYSTWGHIEKMAYAAAEGVRQAGAEAVVKRVPELVPSHIAAQMKNFLDQTGGLWAQGKLVGKVGSVFTSSATQHGGQESTLLTFHPVLLHHGMVVVGLPYAFAGQMGVTEVMGNSPYGASTIAGGDGSRQPSEVELAGARYQGRHVAEIATKLAR